VRDYRRLIHRFVAHLPGGKKAQFLLRQIDRRRFRDSDVEELRRHAPQDSEERSQYLRVLWQWSREHNNALGLEEEDTLSDTGRYLIVRFHIIDRHMAYKRPQEEAVESFVEPGGWTNFRQHPWTPSGILPVPQDPEEAWLDFIAWCQDGPYHRAEPLLRKETYIKVFSENQPYHQWELRQPKDVDAESMNVCP
jgi:hypothetical protein